MTLTIPLTPVAAPVCGPCTLCCKVMGVEELDKPKDVWCGYAEKGKGCVVYDQRPHTCRVFRCLWLEGRVCEGREAFRPDRIHGVLAPTADGLSMVLHEDPGYPGVARGILAPALDQFVGRGQGSVVVRCGEKEERWTPKGGARC